MRKGNGSVFVRMAGAMVEADAVHFFLEMQEGYGVQLVCKIRNTNIAMGRSILYGSLQEHVVDLSVCHAFGLRTSEPSRGDAPLCTCTSALKQIVKFRLRCVLTFYDVTQ